MIAWSWSRLETFEKCPKMFYHKNVAKTVKFEQSPAQLRGERIHAHLENAIKTAHTNDEISHMRPVIERIRAVAWDAHYSEYKICFDDAMHLVSWFSKAAWCRVQADFIGIKGATAVVYDWKTGKKYPSDQLKLTAAAVMKVWPVGVVKTAFVYVDTKQSIEGQVERKQLDSLWQDFGERQEKIQLCAEQGEWPATPSQKACGWCPVSDCQERTLLKPYRKEPK